MFTLRRFFPIIVITALLIGLIGCSKAPAPNQPAATPAPAKDSSITVTDAMGRKVTLAKKAERIVSLAPSNTEILYALGLDKAVVGVDDYSDYPVEAKQKDKVGGFSKPNVEKILSLKPDLILAASLQKEPVEQLEKLNIPVVVLNAKTIAQVEDEIKLVGQLSGTEQAASTVVAKMEDKKNAVLKKLGTIDEKNRPVVYYEVWGDPITTAGPGTFHNELISLAGGTNVAAKADQTYPNYSLETLIAQKPQIMIYGHGAQTKDEVLKRKGWESIPFMKDGKVFTVDENTVSRPGPRIVDALEIFAKILHPEKMN